VTPKKIDGQQESHHPTSEVGWSLTSLFSTNTAISEMNPTSEIGCSLWMWDGASEF